MNEELMERVEKAMNAAFNLSSDANGPTADDLMAVAEPQLVAPEVPRVGQLVADSLRKYADELADFIIETAKKLYDSEEAAVAEMKVFGNNLVHALQDAADKRLKAADEHLAKSEKGAEAIREATNIEAINIIASTVRMQSAGLHLEETMSKFFGDAEKRAANTQNGGTT